MFNENKKNAMVITIIIGTQTMHTDGFTFTGYR